MASSMIHLAVVQEMMKEVSFRDIARLRLGVILPDGAVEGNSHLKKKICENTRYTYDLEIFREQYGAYMKKDDLYLGYYLHLIQDMLYRRFLYGEHGWNSSIPGNVEKLHRDYEDAVAVLDRIPKEVLAAYTQNGEREGDCLW